jgi:hypothetical protein
MSARINDPVFWEAVRNRQANGHRYGQAVFNTAVEFFPKEVRQLNGTDVDPFYNDGRVKDFLVALANLL